MKRSVIAALAAVSVVTNEDIDDSLFARHATPSDEVSY